MTAIRHRVGIPASPADVYAQLSTVEGLRSWWTRDTHGDPGVGGKLRFQFGSPERSCVMEVVDLLPGERVEWRGVDGPDEWIDTSFVFDLSTEDSETVVLFTNDGWREAVPFMHHCTTKWGYYLLGLRAGFAGGVATPFPDIEPVSSWD
jgi:uncharacterized protein YndB with AHSA1/START domain